jgi:hypothetical protein
MSRSVQVVLIFLHASGLLLNLLQINAKFQIQVVLDGVFLLRTWFRRSPYRVDLLSKMIGSRSIYQFQNRFVIR